MQTVRLYSISIHELMENILSMLHTLKTAITLNIQKMMNSQYQKFIPILVKLKSTLKMEPNLHTEMSTYHLMLQTEPLLMF